MGHLRSTALLLTAALACASSPDVDPRYRPAESVLEVLAVLQRHVPDDTYRFDPARDFTGRNVYRSSLLRLENLERMHENGLRAGHMDGVIAFGKGRALERLGAFDLAAEAYRRAAERETDLAEEALRSARVCAAILEAQAVTGGVGQAHVLPGADMTIASPQIVLDRFDERAGLLAWQEEATAGTHHVAVVREQIERTHVERARYFVRLRSVLPDGELRAVAELQRVVSEHGESRHALRHLLDLANLYSELSAEYVAQYPPEGIDFDPAHFRDLVDSGARIYEMVAARDGTSEKIEATRRLEAFLAFALGVDRDRFTP